VRGLLMHVAFETKNNPLMPGGSYAPIQSEDGRQEEQEFRGVEEHGLVER